MRTSFVDGMGPWAAEEQDTNNLGGGNSKGDTRGPEDLQAPES